MVRRPAKVAWTVQESGQLSTWYQENKMFVNAKGLIGMGLLCLSTVAVAEDASTEAAATTSAKPELICSYEQVTGTRFKKKVCYTKEAYDAQTAVGSGTAKLIQSRPQPYWDKTQTTRSTGSQ